MSVEEAVSSSNIPPLLSNTPPPSSTSHNISPSDSIVDDSPNLFDEIQNKPVRALNDTDPVDEYNDLPEIVPGSSFLVEQTLPSLSVPEKPIVNELASSSVDWDPFNTVPSVDQSSSVVAGDSYDAPTGDWANFGAVQTTETSYLSENTSFFAEKPNQIPVKETAQEDEDDEFSDFVDNAECVQAESIIQERTQINLATQHTLNGASAELQISTVLEPVLDFSELADRLFLKADSFFKPNVDSLETRHEFSDVKSNPTWEQLKTYTSINDASISLKFKWYLSNLESFYLESLNLDRAALPVKVSNRLSFFFQKFNHSIQIYGFFF
jgi:hypothetical protein